MSGGLRPFVFEWEFVVRAAFFVGRDRVRTALVQDLLPAGFFALHQDIQLPKSLFLRERESVGGFAELLEFFKGEFFFEMELRERVDGPPLILEEVVAKRPCDLEEALASFNLSMLIDVGRRGFFEPRGPLLKVVKVKACEELMEATHDAFLMACEQQAAWIDLSALALLHHPFRELDQLCQELDDLFGRKGRSEARFLSCGVLQSSFEFAGRRRKDEIVPMKRFC